ncbi:hypothetical protein TTHERM_000550839 (macronuclear) [Tetrahymena thermophila SB210]|uniref:Uncharacterized protein n=1 Tax=Tetrahymena thermophila (strain SB210) TaxID=312017 RepID=W7X9I7_TETTS|nr:hypothetical protein TTHERM_000550839 [Tetrahymena thermophila SB210]EWS76075.1 hypothetical protein TTHERM_000550839 [Tetrahymena thermophila SB210]|eukprot:XP_012651382.1 hypothetical protein TTHERM_000550839 [Tetrahymena thermophila SB210]
MPSVCSEQKCIKLSQFITLNYQAKLGLYKIEFSFLGNGALSHQRFEKIHSIYYSMFINLNSLKKMKFKIVYPINYLKQQNSQSELINLLKRHGLIQANYGLCMQQYQLSINLIIYLCFKQ